MANRTALFICCSVEEAKTIREQAESERRAISAYVLNIVMRILPFEERFGNAPSHKTRPRPIRPRTGILLRCTVQEANRIRAAAARAQAPISTFVLDHLRRSWRARSVPLAVRMPV